MAVRAPFNIFVSHIHEEAKVAATLKQWLHATFPGHVSAFVSSDYEDIPLGGKWLAEIEAAIDSSRLLIALISPVAFERMWIHLEVGWSLGRRIDVLPICHSGSRAAQLPRPYSDYSGVDVESGSFGMRLLQAFTTRLGVSHTAPKALTDALTNDVLIAVRAIQYEERDPTDAPMSSGLPNEQVRILQGLARMANRGDYESESVHLDQLPSLVRVQPASLKFHLKELQERDFVHVRHYSGGPDVVLLPDGAGWLEKNGLMPSD